VVTESGPTYVLTVPMSQLVVTIPRRGLVPEEPGANPTYFKFNNDKNIIIVSGWFFPAARIAPDALPAAGRFCAQRSSYPSFPSFASFASFASLPSFPSFPSFASFPSFPSFASLPSFPFVPDRLL